MAFWRLMAGALLVGYLSLGRSFAYVGVPPLFIGEIALIAFFLLKPSVTLGSWASALLRRSPLSEFCLVLLVFVDYGAWQVGRGLLNDYPLFYTFKFFVFNYYSLYVFLGLWIALHAPHYLRWLVRAVAWVNGIYGISYILVLRHVEIYLPGSEILVFGVPGGAAIAILGLLCFERDLRAVWPVLVLNILVTLAWQVRAEWFAIAVGLLTWSMMTGRFARVVSIGLAGLVVLSLIELAGVKLAGRTSEVSLFETVARIVAVVDVDLAKTFSPNAGDHASTADWREAWWEQIWLAVHAKPMLAAFGHGYGFDLFSLAPRQMREFVTLEIRTPHSIFYYALGYTGWVGVALFTLLQVTIIRLLWRAYRASAVPAGIVFWVVGMTTACFEAGFETPYRGIPFYLLMGMSMAPALRAIVVREARDPREQYWPIVQSRQDVTSRMQGSSNRTAERRRSAHL